MVIIDVITSRPRVMSVEFNSHLPIGSTVTLSPGMGWDGYDLMYGASAGKYFVNMSIILILYRGYQIDGKLVRVRSCSYDYWV